MAIVLLSTTFAPFSGGFFELIRRSAGRSAAIRERRCLDKTPYLGPEGKGVSARGCPGLGRIATGFALSSPLPPVVGSPCSRLWDGAGTSYAAILSAQGLPPSAWVKTRLSYERGRLLPAASHSALRRLDICLGQARYPAASRKFIKLGSPPTAVRVQEGGFEDSNASSTSSLSRKGAGELDIQVTESRHAQLCYTPFASEEFWEAELGYKRTASSLERNSHIDSFNISNTIPK